MTFDRANRSFLVLAVIAVAVTTFSVWGAIAGVLEPMIRIRMSTGYGPIHAAVGLLITLLMAILASSAALGGWAAARQAIASVKLARRVRALGIPLTDELAAAAARTGLSGRVVLIDVGTPFSYVYRAFSPRVAVSRGLLTTLAGAEVRAVLEHERYHVTNLDPLKLAVIRVIRSTLFMLPTLETLHRRYLTDRELAADRRAVRACGRGPLVAALHKVVEDPDSTSLGIGAAIAAPASLDARVHQLETGRQPRPERLSRTRLVCSLAATLTLAATFLACIWGLGGPATVRQATGTGLAPALLLAGTSCALPFAVIALLGYVLIALLARHPPPPDPESRR